MFHHVVVHDTDSTRLHPNLTTEEVLTNYVCPFINKEVTMHKGAIYNMGFPTSMQVYRTDRPVTTEWPVDAGEISDKHAEGSSEDDPDFVRQARIMLFGSDYRDQLIEGLKSNGTDTTEEAYRQAVQLLESGSYRDLRRRLAEQTRERYSFFICPLDNEAVLHNYEFVIKPALKSHGFQIERADEIASAGPVTEVITQAIVKSTLIVADLTDERPNCYYEVGFAHALGKPVIIVAYEGTRRHFDISVHQWHYWRDYADLKPKFEKALAGVLKDLVNPPKPSA